MKNKMSQTSLFFITVFTITAIAVLFGAGVTILLHKIYPTEPQKVQNFGLFVIGFTFLFRQFLNWKYKAEDKKELEQIIVELRTALKQKEELK